MGKLAKGAGWWFLWERLAAGQEHWLRGANEAIAWAGSGADLHGSAPARLFETLVLGKSFSGAPCWASSSFLDPPAPASAQPPSAESLTMLRALVSRRSRCARRVNAS